MSRQYRGQSGPHSIHDARQYAWARLVFGPGAPQPRMRPNRGLLPDLPGVTIVPRRPSLLVTLVRILTLRTILDATVSGEVVESDRMKASSDQTTRGQWPAAEDDGHPGRNDSLAA
jgi:hypothetical protein